MTFLKVMTFELHSAQVNIPDTLFGVKEEPLNLRLAFRPGEVQKRLFIVEGI